jgi:hypothetical protein
MGCTQLYSGIDRGDRYDHYAREQQTKAWQSSVLHHHREADHRCHDIDHPGQDTQEIMTKP